MNNPSIVTLSEVIVIISPWSSPSITGKFSPIIISGLSTKILYSLYVPFLIKMVSKSFAILMVSLIEEFLQH